MAADRTSKRGDTWEPVVGRLTDKNGPIDLSTAQAIRFLGKVTIGQSDTIIDSDSPDPNHGICVNIQVEDGPGPNIQYEWPSGSGDFITIPQNQGLIRFEPTVDAVGVASPADNPYKCEIEVTMPGGKKITFPNRESANPTWALDRDIR